MEHQSKSPENDNRQGTYNEGIVQTSSPTSNESETEIDCFCQQLCDSTEDFTVVKFILLSFTLCQLMVNFYGKHFGNPVNITEKCNEESKNICKS